ncbi:MAG TPA: porin family protein [Bacteroidales bacterium]|jgi:hypothetical protein|nr:porin family protein [Bacteroidales bacterium]
MRHKILIIVVLVFIADSLYSQVRLGLRGGINASRLKGDTEFVTPNPTLQSHYRIKVPNYMMIGYHVGLVSQIQIGTFFIQPEALYTVTRNDISLYDLNSANPDRADAIEQKLNRLDIPIWLGLKLKSFKIGAGPVLTFLISNESDLKKITQYDLQLNNATVGYQAGIGFDIGHFTIDFKYEGSLSKLSDGINVSETEKLEFDSRLSQLIVSIGLFF